MGGWTHRLDARTEAPGCPVDVVVHRRGQPVRASAGGAGAVTAVAPVRNVSRTFWVNGDRQSGEGPHVSAADRGLLADGVFETMRAYGGVIFRMEQHLARLSRSLAALEIPEPPTLRVQVVHALEGIADAAVRLVVTRGVGAGGLLFQPLGDPRPTVIVSVSEAPVFPA